MKILAQLAVGTLLFRVFVFLFDSNAALWLLRIEGFARMSIQVEPVAPTPFVQQVFIYQAILYAWIFAVFLLYRNVICKRTLPALKGALFFLPGTLMGYLAYKAKFEFAMSGRLPLPAETKVIAETLLEMLFIYILMGANLTGMPFLIRALVLMRKREKARL